MIRSGEAERRFVTVHDESGLEVEFVRASGRTQAVVQLDVTDVRPVLSSI